MKGIVAVLLLWSYAAYCDVCQRSFDSLANSAAKLRPEVVLEIQGILSEGQNLNGQADLERILFSIFGVLKEEEEKFLDTYLNRSGLKKRIDTSLTTLIRDQFRLPMNLTVSDVQTFYSNEIRRLLILTDLQYRKRLSKEQVKSISFESEASRKSAEKLARVFLLMLNERPEHPVLVLGQEDAVKLFEDYQLIDQHDLGLIQQAVNGKTDPDFVVLKNSSLGDRISWLQRYFRLENAFFCCQSSPGCTVCPWNRGFRNRIE